MTLIDNIFTNDLSACSSGMFLCDISDHFPIYCIINKSINNSRKDTFISKRVFNDDDLLKVAHILQNTNWDLCKCAWN